MIKTYLKILFNLLTHPLTMLKALKELNGWIREDRCNPKAPAIKQRCHWDKICREIASTSIRNPEFQEYLQVIRAFYTASITCLKDFPDTVPDEDIILLVAVKNDSSRIEHILNHYRRIGVHHFVFIDNGSTDDTLERILKQKDTACYQTGETFSSFFKAGWLSRLAAHYGSDRWYIVIDSDELFVYPEMTRLSIRQYVKTAEEKDIKCIKTVMLDVYPDGLLMDETKSDEEYMESCRFFDRGDNPEATGGYKYDSKGNTVQGGMRARLFFEETGVILTRLTLLKFPRVFLLGPHTVYPKTADLTSPHAGALLHYKFLPSDKERYRDIEREGTYYNASEMYKTINTKLEQSPSINAMCEASVEFNPDDFVRYLPFIHNL